MIENTSRLDEPTEINEDGQLETMSRDDDENNQEDEDETH
jgi:hypothetical protein